MTKILSSADRGSWIAAHLALHYAVLNERNAHMRYIKEQRACQRPETAPQMIGLGAGETYAVFNLNKVRNYLGLSAFEFHDPYRNNERFHHAFVEAALQTGRILRQVEKEISAGEFYADSCQLVIAV